SILSLVVGEENVSSIRLRIRHSSIISLLVAAVVLTVSARAANQTPPPTPPSRIVSLIPAVTEMLFAIGAGNGVVGVSSFDHYPPEVEKIQRIGALLDPDLE